MPEAVLVLGALRLLVVIVESCTQWYNNTFTDPVLYWLCMLVDLS